MDFVRSNFGTNKPLPVEHFFPHFLAGLLCVLSKPAKKVRKKCSTGRGSFVPNLLLTKLGPVAGPVIQANGRLTFEDDLRSGGLLYFTAQ